MTNFIMPVPRIWKGDIKALDDMWRNLQSTVMPPEVKKSGVQFSIKLGESKDNLGNSPLKNITKFTSEVIAISTTNTAKLHTVFIESCSFNLFFTGTAVLKYRIHFMMMGNREP